MKLNVQLLPDDLFAAVRSIAGAVKEAGGRALMVGGAVRDLLLGDRAVKDVDLEVYGLEPERLQRVIGERFPFDECGLSFGVMKIKHFDIDVSLPRRAGATSPSTRCTTILSPMRSRIRTAASTI